MQYFVPRWDENPCGQSIPETISWLRSDLLREYSRPWLLRRAKELGNDTDCIELILEWSLVKRVPVDLGDFPTHVRS
jgi:hypothetical protein